MRQLKKKISEIKEELEQWCVEFRECFYSKPSGRLAVDYIYGLLSGVERKNMCGNSPRNPVIRILSNFKNFSVKRAGAQIRYEIKIFRGLASG